LRTPTTRTASSESTSQAPGLQEKVWETVVDLRELRILAEHIERGVIEV
jgi:hypothetical protein